MEENERALRSMSVGDVLDYSIAVYKRNFKKLTLLALIFYVPFMFLYSFAVSYFSGELGSFTNGPRDFADTEYMLMAYYGVILLAGIILAVYSVTIKQVMDAAIIKIIYTDVVARKSEEWRNAVREGFKKLPSFIGNKLLYYLILFGIGSSAIVALIIVAVVVTIAITAMSATFSATRFSGGSAAGIWTGIILVLLVVLAIYLGVALFVSYFAIRFGFGTQSIVIENKKAVDAISRSSELTKKSFWHIAMSYLLGLLLFFTLPVLLAAVAQLLLAVDRNLFILATVFTQVVSAVLYPYVVTLGTMLFINMKVKKEALDLEVKVDVLLEEQHKKENDMPAQAEPDFDMKDGETPNE